MKKRNKTLTKKLILWALIVAAVLSMPLLLRWPWSLGDYIFAAVILYGSAATYELTTKNMKNNSHRILIGAGIVVLVIVIWGWAVA